VKPLRVRPEAADEIRESAHFYEARRSNLGKRFVAGVESSFERIRSSPSSFRIIEGNVRCCRIQRFPFGVVFREESQFVEIVAVMHFKRRPGYWHDRLDLE